MSMSDSNKIKRLSYDGILRMINAKACRIHFVGVGGVSMYSLAVISLKKGCIVTGSDREDNHRTKALRSLGVNVKRGHCESNAYGADLVVYSHAISESNPELIYAHSRGIPNVSRAEYLAALMLEYSCRIGVCGSHGKSSTVAMLDCIFKHAGASPTTLSGADLSDGEPYRLGCEDLLIYESCEYRDSFLRFSPTIAIGLNLELDHTDYFSDIEHICSSFASALGKAKKCAIVSGDDANLRRATMNFQIPLIRFGAGEENDYRYSITAFKDLGFSFSLEKMGVKLGDFEIGLPGAFNVHNATAAIVAALEYGIDVSTVADAISLYKGIPRRLEYVGQRYGRAVYYDYAHHPTEISASISTLKMLTKGPLTVIFKPHTYSRTKSLWQGFCESLSKADYLLLTEIYPAREEAISGVSSMALAAEIGEGARCVSESDIVYQLDLHTRGAIVIMGAGDLEEIKKKILNN